MNRVVILPLAKQDIKDAAHWYNLKQKGLGKRFTRQIRQKVDLLKREPYITATRYDDVKTAVLDIFPFMIHYTVNEPQKLIIISAVLHTSRNPDMWKSEREDSNI